MRRLLAFVVIVVVLIGSTPVTASPKQRASLTDAQAASIDRFVSLEMARTHVPGAEVGIYSRGKILLAKGYGLANVELGVPVKPRTIFQSGSVGKQFVSAAIMMLVEEGRVSLEDPIVKYFPNAPRTWTVIRVKNLLSHTSGLAEYESDDRTGPNGPFYLRLDFTEEQLLRKIEALPIENAPGAAWNYRNTNYVLLGLLIHRVTGSLYADFLAQRIFKPLGMTSTRLISEADIVPNRAAGYRWTAQGLKNQDWISPTFNATADGTLYFNVLDLAKWDAALYTTRLLRNSSLRKIWTVYKLNDGRPNRAKYGFAWQIEKQNDHVVLEHSGAWQGFTCDISRYPNDSLTVVVLTNLDAGHARPSYLARVIAGLAEPALLPRELTAIADDRPQIALSLTKLLDAQTNRDSSLRRSSHDTLTALVNAEDRKLIEPVWPGGTLTLLRRKANPAAIVSGFRLTKGTRSILITFGLDGHGNATLIQFEPDEQYGSRDT